MKVKFASHSIVAGKRGMIVIDLINKGETHRKINGEDYVLKYGPEGKVKICITKMSKTGLCEGWARFSAQVIQKPAKAQNKAAGRGEGARAG